MQSPSGWGAAPPRMELVEADQRQLRALPLEDGLVVLEVRELDLGAGREPPFQHRRERLASDDGIKSQALVPEAARIAHLDGVAPEDHGGEVRLLVMTLRLQQKRPG